MAVSVLRLFIAGSWVGLQCVIEAFPGHTHLLFILNYTGLVYKFDPFVDKLALIK